MESYELSRKGSFQDLDEEERRSLFLRKTSNVGLTGLKRLRNKPKSGLAAFSELSLSRSSFRLEQDDDRVRVEYYVNENTLKEKLHLYFFKNQRSSLRIRIARFVLKLFTCVLYIIRVVSETEEDSTNAACYGCTSSDKTEYLKALNLTEEEFLYHAVINWDAIYWVKRSYTLWLLHVIFAIISFSETILLIYLNYKGNIFQQLLTRRFIIELVATVPFITTLFWTPLRNLFVPVFLNCWLAKYALENMFNDLHRAMQRSQSALSQQLTILSATLICLVFTSVCGVQHFQRAGHRHLDLFHSTYFVVVTFSTVGYGDFVPDIWPSQLFMVAMICIAFIVLPTQFEQLAFTWMERQKLGGSYSSHRAQHERHVVVCSTTLHADTIMDFLNEFYAHPLLQDYFVVLLSPCELDPTMRMILSVPIWSQRVIYIQGSCLKDSDLVRARMGEAEACFILAARNYADKTAADEHTILRSWAVKDFAPLVPQYVQIIRPDNKLHVRFAEHVVCEDEFKYALLANNCLFPGASTLVTLLLHTSRGQEGQMSKEEWQRLYGKCSGNEIYHIRLSDSRFFGEYEGKSFTYASFHSHRKFGVCLVGVRPAQLPEFYEDTILLNPGPRHIMRKSDLCFYLSITKEEHSAFVTHEIGISPVTSHGPTTSTPHQPQSTGNNEDTETHNKQSSKPESLGIDDSGKSSESDSRLLKNSENETKGYLATEATPPVFTTIQIALEPSEKMKTVEKPKGRLEPGQVALTPANTNLLMLPSLTIVDQKTNIRRPSILPVPESFGSGLEDSSTVAHFNPHQLDHAGGSTTDGGGTSGDEAEDDVPSGWIGPTETSNSVVKGFPPVSPYIGVTPTLCYLLREKKQLCCLQLAQACEHCSNRTAYDYNWQNRSIILAADYASSAIYNFIIPLRAHFRPKGRLNPIILLLERRPDTAFLDSVSYFPMIYWFQGSIDCLDDLLRSGITLAESVVVVNKELSNSAEEDTLSDCNTIVAVQMMFRFFPHIKIVTELSQSSNMRFMQFRAHDAYALHLSRMEKREKERGSHISYMFRLPFAAGSVFSASMLDTLLYQAFVKDYLITFVRLLLGIDQAPGSGFLTSMQLTGDDLWIRTYGRLYQKLCSTTCEIPIGIYRTQDSYTESDDDYYEEPRDTMMVGSDVSRRDSRFSSSDSLSKRLSSTAQHGSSGDEPRNFYRSGCFRGACGSDASSFTSAALTVTDEAHDSHAQLIERAEIANLVRSRMQSLGLPAGDTTQQISEKRSSLSFVIINPSCDLKIKENDIVYLIRPSPFSAQKTFERHNSRRKSTLNPMPGNGINSNAEELQRAAYGMFQDKGSGNLGSRRRSSSGSVFTPNNPICIPVPVIPLAPKVSPIMSTSKLAVAKSTSLSLPDSPRQRSNSLRTVPAEDILIRRSNSLRQSLGNGRRLSHSPCSHEEFGLPAQIHPEISPISTHSHSQPIQPRLISGNESINFQVTPPIDDPICHGGILTPSVKTNSLQGTIV